MAPTKGRVARP